MARATCIVSCACLVQDNSNLHAACFATRTSTQSLGDVTHCVLVSLSHSHARSLRTAKAKQVVIGTLNVLGNARNPIEFCPKQFTTPKWRRASDLFKQALFSVTFK